MSTLALQKEIKQMEQIVDKQGTTLPPGYDEDTKPQQLELTDE